MTAAVDGSYAFWVNSGHYDILNGAPGGVTVESRVGPQSSNTDNAPHASGIAVTPYFGNGYSTVEAMWEGLVAGSPNIVGTPVFSGTPAFTNAVNMNSANAAQVIFGQASELLTLSTGGLTTDTTANLLPAGAIIDSVVCRVTTTITTTTNWAVGDATTVARFSAANATLAAGTTSVGLDHWSGAVTTLAAGPSQAAAAKVRITCTGSNPGAGAIRITVFYRQFVAPTS